MDLRTYLGMFSVAGLVLGAGVLVVSLIASNPLFRTATYRLDAVAGLAIAGLTVAVLLIAGTRSTRTASSYW